MIFSLDWLRRYVEAEEEPAELAERLTEIGFAVEQIEAVGDDVVFDVEVTTNRVDAMSHVGLARELAAALGRPLRPPSPPAPSTAGEPATRVEIDAPSSCRRYDARVIRGVRVGPSPEWLRRRLETLGSRPVNNVVDATNFVLWELGQPLHAFDLGTLAEGRIVVRAAAPGETLETLDGECRSLDPSMLVIADAERPVALAGIMGGAETEVGMGTADVLLESAWFDPVSVRRTARSLGMHTDASHRFERGADPEGPGAAADRAVELILELAGGEVDGPPVVAEGEPLGEPSAIELSGARLAAFAGIEVPGDEVESNLASLGFDLEAEGGDRWRVTVPSWRRFDVSEAADLYEEVLRLVGYDRIPTALPELAGSDGPEIATHRLRREVRDHLAACGLAEAVSYAFYSGEDDASFPHLPGVGGAVDLENPLSELYALMRRSLLPGLLASARFNRRRNIPASRLFEIGHVFWAEDGETRERDHLGIVAGGVLGTPWEGESRLDFFAVKGILESLVERFGRRLGARRAERLGLRPGLTADLLVDGRVVGVLGEVVEDDPLYPLVVGEIDLAVLLPIPGPVTVSMPSRRPGIAVDLTLTHPDDVEWSAIEAAIRDEDVPDLDGFRLKDRYTGEGVPRGAVNTTIGFFYTAPDRSLTQDEVNDRQRALASELEDRFGVGSGS